MFQVPWTEIELVPSSTSSWINVVKPKFRFSTGFEENDWNTWFFSWLIEVNHGGIANNSLVGGLVYPTHLEKSWSESQLG